MRRRRDEQSLEGYGYRELRTMLGEPGAVHVFPARPFRWQPGDGRPALASDDPAVVQAMGRCAVHRLAADMPGGLAFRGRERSIHPAECGWCDYPLEELLAACDFAIHASGYVIDEIAIWTGKDGRSEVRSTGRGGTYGNPAWESFFASEPRERRRRIAEAARP